jgi:hypothetical protein
LIKLYCDGKKPLLMVKKHHRRAFLKHRFTYQKHRVAIAKFDY